MVPQLVVGPVAVLVLIEATDDAVEQALPGAGIVARVLEGEKPLPESIERDLPGQQADQLLLEFGLKRSAHE